MQKEIKVYKMAIKMTQRGCFAVRKIHLLKLILLTKTLPKNLLLKFSATLTKSTKTPTLSQKWHLTHTKLGVKI